MKWTRFIPFGLLLAFVCSLMLIADMDEPFFLINFVESFKYGDKVSHFFLFGTLALLLNVALDFRKTKFSDKIYLGSLLVFSFAIAEEFTQLAFASRTFDYADMISDALGVLALSSVYVMRFLKRFSLITN